MWRDGFLDTSLLGLPLYHYQYHSTGEVMTTAVQEDIVLLATLYVKMATVGEPQLQLVDGLVGDGNEPFLTPLA